MQPVPEAEHLDVILYSREQLVDEYKAMPAKAGGGEVGTVPHFSRRWQGAKAPRVRALAGAPLRTRTPPTASPFEPFQDPEQLLPNVPWGIISVKAQDEPFETPVRRGGARGGACVCGGPA